MTSLQGTGEEWKALGSDAAPYKPNDALLAKAKSDIQQFRMRQVTLRLINRAGKPLAHQKIHIVQHKNEFPVGDQLWSLDRMYRFGEFQHDRARYYKQRFAEVFNSANALCYWTERPVNDGPKIEDQQGEPQVEGFAACVDWANAQGLTAKGHPLFWSIPKCIPEWLKRYDYATQMRFVEVRIRNMVSRFKGKVRLWDAINEPLWEAAFKNLPTRNWPHIESTSDMADYIEPILRWCREEDPDACFLINDYGLEKDAAKGAPLASMPASQAGKPVTAALQRQRFAALVAELQQRGAPPNAIGMQAHTGGWLSHEAQQSIYDELAATGLPLHITEFWADTDHLGNLPQDVIDNLQADYIANYLTCAFAHPAIDAFFFWGFMSSAVQWNQHSSHQIKPVYTRVQQLLKHDWLTNLHLTTDADGQAQFRGFLGQYAARTLVSPLNQQWTGSSFSITREHTGPLTIKVNLA